MPGLVNRKKQEAKVGIMEDLKKKGKARTEPGPVSRLLSQGYASPIPGEKLGEKAEAEAEKKRKKKKRKQKEDDEFERGMSPVQIIGPN